MQWIAAVDVDRPRLVREPRRRGLAVGRSAAGIEGQPFEAIVRLVNEKTREPVLDLTRSPWSGAAWLACRRTPR